MTSDLVVRDLSKITGTKLTFFRPACQSLDLVNELFLHHLLSLIHAALAIEISVKFFPHLA